LRNLKAVHSNLSAPAFYDEAHVGQDILQAAPVLAEAAE